tara:strand:- start:350 stop:607 length:258 start_codon:yes stop_codon:yes gene_type:complete
MSNTPKRRNFNNYRWAVYSKETDSVHYYKKLAEIKEKYGISRANIYLMVKEPEKRRRQYAHLEIEKVNISTMVIDHGVDANLIYT